MSSVAMRDVQTDLEGVFLSPAWADHNIVVVPDDFPLVGEGVKFKIDGSSRSYYYGGYGITGKLYLSIYTKAGRGQTGANEIIDILNTLFQGRTFDSGTQTGPSTSISLGIDRDNRSLMRTDYSVPFTKFS